MKNQGTDVFRSPDVDLASKSDVESGVSELWLATQMATHPARLDLRGRETTIPAQY
jgi:hypothetical protein